MTKTFLEFFGKLQERQEPAPVGNQGGHPSSAALAAAAAAPTSRPQARRHAGDLLGAEAGPSGVNPSNTAATLAPGSSISMAEIQAAASRVGPQLALLRSEQDKQPHSRRETYSMEHVQRLDWFKPQHDYDKDRGNKQYCKDHHPQPCPYGCKTCHFCRQRTIDTKTVCSKCDGVNNNYGGPARGYWCGSCLWLRMGENIDEVINRSDWVCPGCRDLCNCSGNNCIRIKRGWFPTNQLSHEAQNMGFRSVAHYLVLTHVSATAAAAPIADNTHTERVAMTRQRPEGAVPDPLVHIQKRQRTIENFARGTTAREQALERASQSRLQREVAAVLAELGNGGSSGSSNSTGIAAMSALQQLLAASSGNVNGARSGTTTTASRLRPATTFLGILDEDIDGDDEDGSAIVTRFTTTSGPPAPLLNAVLGGSRQGTDTIARSNDLLPPRRPPLLSDRMAVQPGGGGGAGPSRAAAADVIHRGLPGSDYQQRSLAGPSRGPQIAIPGWNLRPRARNNNRGQAAEGGEGAAAPTRMEEEEEEEEVMPATQPIMPETQEIDGMVEEDDGHVALPPAAATAVEETAAPKSPPCTDAHTPLAMAAASLSSDEFVWNNLCLRASGVVHDINALFRYHPDCPDYAGPLLGQEADVAMYEAAYDNSLVQLKAVLHEAEALLLEDVAVPNTALPSNAVPGTLHSYAGVRKAINLLTYLARLLPEQDVRWRVERRILGAEPFVEFKGSDARTRAILLHGMLELFATLHRRGFPTHETAAAISKALACLAQDMVTVLPVLDAIVANKPLPEQDFCIGTWKYDAHARKRSFLELFNELSVIYGSLMQVLTSGMDQVALLCRAIGVSSAAFITLELVHAVLGPSSKLPGSIKRDALALFCSVLDLTSPRHDAPLTLHLTGDERSTREMARRKLCDVLESTLIPNLEIMVQSDYHFWGDQRRAAALADNDDDGTDRQAEQVGSEKVETLAQCYGYMVACGRMGWPAIEAKATEPYAFSIFWRQANAAHRHFAVFLLAHSLAHAPDVLTSATHVATALKLWLQALVDTGKHQCSWYFTNVLANHPNMAPLFAGLPADALDIRADGNGDKRAALVASVAAKMYSNDAMRQQLSGVICDVDAVLAARKKELETTAFDPGAALKKWESSSAAIVASLLRSVSGFLSPTFSVPLGHRNIVNQHLCRLLNRVAVWAVSSVANAHGDYYVDHPGAAVASGDARLTSVADIRQKLQSSAYARVPEILDILVSGGAPNTLDTIPVLLEPLWVIINGCIEHGSGAVEPTPVDCATFDLLAASLVPSEACNMDARMQLCEYVLSTFIRRYLQRSSLRHSSNERAAVNALRLVKSVLGQPGMRSSGALNAALAVLMRPLLDTLHPEGGSQPSVGAKALVFSLLTELAAAHPSIVPALEPLPQRYDTFETGLHAFWMGTCQDALQCIYGLLPSVVAAPRIEAARLALATQQATVLWPSTPETVAQISNALMSSLGRPRSLEAVEKVFNKPGGVAGLPQVSSAAGATGLFRPGDFPWKVAENAVKLLETLAGLPAGTTFGCQWAAACFPAVHHLIAGAGNASKLLHAAYLSYRSAIGTALGQEFLASYALAAPKPPETTGAAGAQEQRQPNTVLSGIGQQAAVARPPEPLVNLSAECNLSNFGRLPLKICAPVIAKVVEVIDRTRPANGATPSVICVLQDYSGAHGTEARARLMALCPDAMTALLSLSIDRHPVLRFSELKNLAPPKGRYACILGTLPTTIVEIEPRGAMADALRHGGQPAAAPPQPAVSEEAECPAPAVESRLYNNIHSQTTEKRIGASMPVKMESAAPTPVKQHQDLDKDALAEVHKQVVNEMGFDSSAAKAAMRAVIASNQQWKKMSREQFVAAVVVKL